MVTISSNRIKSLIPHYSEMSDFSQKVDFVESEVPFFEIHSKFNIKISKKKLLILNGTQDRLNGEDTYIGIQRHRITNRNHHKNVLFLGDLKANPSLIEIYSRDTTEIFIDLNVLKKSEIPNCKDAKPSGLTSEEFAKLARYLGFANSIEKITISNSDQSILSSESVLSIIAEFLWYFIEGTTFKVEENPLNEEYASKHHLQHSQFSESLILIKSRKSDRCWLKKEDFEPLIPCTAQEYTELKNDEIPSRLWQLFMPL